MTAAQTTVRNTDKVDFDGAAEAMELISRAGSHGEVAVALAAFSGAMAFDHFLLLQYLPGAASGHEIALHSCAAALVPDLACSAFVSELLTSPMPRRLAGDIGGAEFQCGLGISAPYAVRPCVLILGSAQEATDERVSIDQQGLGLLAVIRLGEAMQRIAVAACPVTERELLCLRYTALGLTARQTAQQLGVSHRTVEEYLERGRRRLGVENTSAAVVLAIRRGWITDQELQTLARISHRQYGAG